MNLLGLTVLSQRSGSQQVTWRVLAVQGNNFTYTCNAQQSYINDICLSSAAPSPAQLPPMGTSTAGSRTASGGLPRTNQTLPANNGSLPDQMQYPGALPESGLQHACMLSEQSTACWEALCYEGVLRAQWDCSTYQLH